MSKNYLIESTASLMTIIARVFILTLILLRFVHVSYFQRHELAGYLIESELCKHFYWLEI